MGAVVDRALLGQAYPAGWLAARGVLTLGGWTCVGTIENPDAPRPGTGWWHPAEGTCRTWEGQPEWSHAHVREAIARGDFLPAVDPAEPATWACVLRDLAVALSPFVEGASDFHLRRWALDFSGHGPWRLCWTPRDEEQGGVAVAVLRGPASDPPALVVLRERARLRATGV